MLHKGIIRIVVGTVLLFLQILSLIGDITSGAGLAPAGSFFYNVAFYIGYFSAGICGGLLFVFGVRAYRTGQTAQLVLHQGVRTVDTVIKYAAIVLLGLRLISLIYTVLTNNIVSYMTFFLWLVCFVFMLIYLCFFQGRKPSFLFSASILFAGAAYLFGTGHNLLSYILYLFTIERGWLPLVFSTLPVVITGILYLVLGVLLYSENFSVSSVKILGSVLFAFVIIEQIIGPLILVNCGFTHVFRLSNFIFPLVVFLYTSIVQISNPKAGDADLLFTERCTFCRICGAKLPAGSVYCNKCGTKILEPIED